ncbi:MAG: long-chain-fatty-acyl-CoA reductase [Sphingomonadales bacterium BRH_c3]|nr:MAG: long-chain-fatty-acyl-CoA reductase [Sphingomonadales bacterium BRH_c3]
MLHKLFERERVREMAERTVGIASLEGWVERETLSGHKLSVRCFGARTLHIVAGNSPMVSASTIIRNAILRSDAIIKAPSNDPFTALALAETMCDFAPDHPITKHLTVAYWRGGDEKFEQQLYSPDNIEKIVAWGGFAALKHVTRYIQPGLEQISLDPKLSATIIGSEAFTNPESMRNAAQRLAVDIGALNQVACVNSRVSYVMSGTDEAGVERLKEFGQLVYDAMVKLPPQTSTTPKAYDQGLKEQVDALRLSDDWYTVIGGQQGEGAIIVSHLPEPVDFANMLNDRTGNLVPVDAIEGFTGAINSYTQTVGVYPESLKDQLIDILPLYGAQRIVSLGYATASLMVGPNEGIELIRRMGKWISNEVATPDRVAPPWSPEAFRT